MDNKIVGKGEFNADIYMVVARYPLDTGQNLTKTEIDDMMRPVMLLTEISCWLF